MAVPPRYDAAAQARWVPEPPKDSGRGPFARDRARVVHSSALRRLAGKTQVVGPTSDDFVRNRLTHTLEVAQVGRDLGAALGCDPDVVEAACLAHDLGHPPFGHNGEVALDEAAQVCGGFEGNAHTLRLLTRLEAKTSAPDGRSVGLNLTRASLDASTKYPWGRETDQRKYGVFDADRDVFDWVREGAPAGRRCVEAQVMDWADDVAYSVHDVEDAVQAGALDLRALRDPGERSVLALVARDTYAAGTDPQALLAALQRLLALPWWPPEHDGSRRSLAALKDLTSRLVGRFTSAAQAATRDAYGPGGLTRYAADLVVPDGTRLEVAVLKGMAAHYVMGAQSHLSELEGQRALLAELVERLDAGAPDLLAPAYRLDWAGAGDDEARRRVVIDQVAGLTDPSAVALHRQLASGPGAAGRG